MRHREGPTKKLAPAIALDTSCPHVFTEDEGMQLEIDCTRCAGAHDLNNSKCFTGVVNVMSEGADPETIVLKRFIHKRYRGRLVSSAASAAVELSTLSRALASIERPSDRQCRTCMANTEQIIAALKRRLLEDPIQYIECNRPVLATVRERANLCACTKARECVSKGLSISTLVMEDDA